MSASGLIQPVTQTVPISLAATGFTTPFVLRYAEGYYAELIVTTSAGTVDVALQHSTDGGTTWQTLPLKFAQSTAASATASFALAFKPAIGLSDAATAITPALTGTAVAANIPFNIKNVRLAVTLGTAGTTVGSVRFTMQPKGNVVQ